MTGTNSGPFMGMPATNKKVDIMGIDWIKWENGKFTDHWGAMEDMKMMTQLGMMPDMNHQPGQTTASTENQPKPEEKK